MSVMIPAKFHFNRLMLTLIFGIRASVPPPPPWARQTTEKAGPDRVKLKQVPKQVPSYYNSTAKSRSPTPLIHQEHNKVLFSTVFDFSSDLLIDNTFEF